MVAREICVKGWTRVQSRRTYTRSPPPACPTHGVRHRSSKTPARRSAVDESPNRWGHNNSIGGERRATELLLPQPWLEPSPRCTTYPDRPSLYGSDLPTSLACLDLTCQRLLTFLLLAILFQFPPRYYLSTFSGGVKG